MQRAFTVVVRVTGVSMCFPSQSYKNMPFQSGDPTTQNRLLNLNGQDHYHSLLTTLAETKSSPPKHYLQKYAKAIFKHEFQKSYWTENECVASLLGLSPHFVDEETFYTNMLGDTLACEGVRLFELVRRAIKCGDLPTPTRPGHLIDWAIKQHISMPKELTDTAQEFNCGNEYKIGALQSANKTLKNKIKEYEHNLSTARSELEKIQLANKSLCKQIGDLRHQIEHTSRHCDRDDNRTVTSRGSTRNNNESTKNQKKTSLAGQTLKYHTAAKVAYGLAKRCYDYNVSVAAKSNTSKIVSDLYEQGIKVDDQTLSVHLRVGSEEAAKA